MKALFASHCKWILFYFKFFVEQGPFFGATDCPYFVTLPMEFYLTCMLTCLRTVNLRVKSGATPAYTCLHCTAGPIACKFYGYDEV